MPDRPDEGASSSGYHYLSELQKCPRRFYLHSILNLEPTDQKIALSLGKAWHNLLAELFKGTPEAEALASTRAYWFSLVPTNDETLGAWSRIVVALPEWKNTMCQVFQAAKFEAILPSITAVEDEVGIVLPSGKLFTARLDVRFKVNGRHYVMEHKSTSWIPQKVIDGVSLEDQITGYFMADALPNDPSSGVLVDVTGLGGRGSGTKTEILYRSREEVQQFVQGIESIFADIDRKKRELEDGKNPFFVFPRNGAWCAMFGCPYVDICRLSLESKDLTSLEGFTVKEPANGEDDAE